MACLVCGGSSHRAPGHWFTEFLSPGGGVFSGTRIISLSTVVAAPAASAILSDLGAEVIKVEEPGGDPLRKLLWPAQPNRQAEEVPCTTFEYTNRGCQSVVLDLKSDEGRARLKELLLSADVFITNTRVQVLRDWNLDYEALAETHPRLVYAHFTAWGRDGPMASEVGYDVAAFNAALGMMHFMSPGPGHDLPRYPTGLGDMVSSMGLAAACALGLLQRTGTGKGQLVDTSLLGTAAWCMSSALLCQRTVQVASAVDVLDALAPGRSWGNKAFRTKDGEWLAFSCLDATQQQVAIRALLGAECMLEPEPPGRRPSAIGGAGVAVHVANLEGRPRGQDGGGDDPEPRLRIAIASRSLADSLTLLREAGVDWVGPAVMMEDVVRSDVYRRLACPLPGMDDCDEVLRQPLTFGSFDHRPRQRAPPLGHHTASVVRHLGKAEGSPGASPRLAAVRTARNRLFLRFSDLRVVELGESVAAAAAGAQLADLGVDVVKVEAPGGDPTRGLAVPAVFSHLNRGKKSVVVDLDDGDARSTFRELVASADALVVSLPKGRLEALGLDWESLRVDMPGLVFVHVSPRGYEEGGWHGLGAEFLPFFAGGAGLLDSTRPNARLSFAEDSDMPPQLVPFWGEHAVSLQVVLAVAAALFHKNACSRGQKVEVVIESAPIWFSGLNIGPLQHARITSSIDPFSDLAARFPYANSGIDRNGLRMHGGIFIPGMQAYKCRDGWVQLLELELMEPLQRIYDALDANESGVFRSTGLAAAWASLCHWGPAVERVLLYVTAWRDAYREACAVLTCKEASRRLEEGKVRFTVVGSLAEAEQHPQFAHLQLLREGVVRAPITMHGSPISRLIIRAPRLGEHSAVLLK